MDIRQNIFISVLIHTLIITSALIVGGKIRDAACRIPENHMIVSLFKEVEDIARDKILKQSQHIERNTTTSKDRVVLPEPAMNDKVFAYSISTPDPNIAIETKMLHSSTKGNENNPPSPPLSTDPPISPFSKGGEEGLQKQDNISQLYALIRAAIEKVKTYPFIARKKKIEGTVITEFSINNKGYPQDITVRKSSGYEILDSTAINIIKKAAPFPQIDGHIVIPIKFSLRDAAQSQ